MKRIKGIYYDWKLISFFFYWNIVDLQYVFVSPGATVVKNPSASAGDRRNVGLSLGEEDSLE